MTKSPSLKDLDLLDLLVSLKSSFSFPISANCDNRFLPSSSAFDKAFDGSILSALPESLLLINFTPIT